MTSVVSANSFATERPRGGVPLHSPLAVPRTTVFTQVIEDNQGVIRICTTRNYEASLWRHRTGDGQDDFSFDEIACYGFHNYGKAVERTRFLSKLSAGKLCDYLTKVIKQ